MLFYQGTLDYINYMASTIIYWIALIIGLNMADINGSDVTPTQLQVYLIRHTMSSQNVK